MRIDLNADVGESQQPGEQERDCALGESVSSFNIACGGHAGSPQTMRRLVIRARACGVGIGAHPGYPDPENFGRKTMPMSARDLRQTLKIQIGTLATIADQEGAVLRHVKPHGALYHDASRDVRIAEALIDAIGVFDLDLALVAMAGSSAATLWRSAGVRVIEEAFADRRYEPDGRLRERSSADALIEDPDQAAAQALLIVRERAVSTTDGSRIPIHAQSICLHSDAPGSLARVQAVRRALAAAGVRVVAPDDP